MMRCVASRVVISFRFAGWAGVALLWCRSETERVRVRGSRALLGFACSRAGQGRTAGEQSRAEQLEPLGLSLLHVLNSRSRDRSRLDGSACNVDYRKWKGPIRRPVQGGRIVSA